MPGKTSNYIGGLSIALFDCWREITIWLVVWWLGKPWENHGKTMGKRWENGDLYSNNGWLVVWNMNFMNFHSVGNVIIPTDELHDFSEG